MSLTSLHGDKGVVDALPKRNSICTVSSSETSKRVNKLTEMAWLISENSLKMQERNE